MRLKVITFIYASVTYGWEAWCFQLAGRKYQGTQESMGFKSPLLFPDFIFILFYSN